MYRQVATRANRRQNKRETATKIRVNANPLFSYWLPYPPTSTALSPQFYPSICHRCKVLCFNFLDWPALRDVRNKACRAMQGSAQDLPVQSGGPYQRGYHDAISLSRIVAFSCLHACNAATLLHMALATSSSTAMK